VKRIPESRIRSIVNEMEQMLLDLQAEYDDDETDVEQADSYRADSPPRGTGGTPLEEAPPEKIQIPTSLVVVDETKKAKR